MPNPIRFFNISAIEMKLFIEAFWRLLGSVIITLFFPIKWQSKKWGNHQTASPCTEDILNKNTIRLIGLSIRRAKRVIPFQTKCLAEAVAAKQMLNKRGIASTIYLGISKDDEKQLIAHAWLRCGDCIVTGKKGMEKFVEVGMFS